MEIPEVVKREDERYRSPKTTAVQLNKTGNTRDIKTQKCVLVNFLEKTRRCWNLIAKVRRGNIEVTKQILS